MIKFELRNVERLPKGLRQYTKEDLFSVQEIYNETAESGANSPVLTPVSAAQIARFLEHCMKERLPVGVVERDGGVVGWMAINRFCWGPEVCGRTGELSVYMKRTYTGRGLGRELGQACVHLGREAGLDAVVSWVLEENYASQAANRALGFELWGRFPKIARFGGKRKDVLLFGYDLKSRAAAVSGNQCF